MPQGGPLQLAAAGGASANIGVVQQRSCISGLGGCQLVNGPVFWLRGPKAWDACNVRVSYRWNVLHGL